MDLKDIINNNVRLALAEDIGSGDITAALLPEKICDAHVICREPAVICGYPWFESSFLQLSNKIRINWLIDEGSWVKAGATLCHVTGSQKAIVSAERTALNFLQTLSATATITRKYVDLVNETGVIILDTRKTLPGLRQAQKYAVRSGGGKNHRMGLHDAMLIKENHIRAAGSITEATDKARGLNKDGVFIEVEIETLSQLEEARACQVDRILLDNFEISELEEAVRLIAGNIPLEASGGINLENVRDIAKTGVNYVSIGSLTKNIRAIDLSLIFD